MRPPRDHRAAGRTADALIADLRAEVREVGVGELGLDRDVAQQKLRQYPLPRSSEVRFVFDGIWTVTERLGGLPDGFYRGRLHDRVAKGLAAARLWNAIRGGERESGLRALDDVLDVLEEGGRGAYVHVPTVKSSQRIAIPKPRRDGIPLTLEAGGDVRFVQRLVGDSLEHPGDLEISLARAEERRREKKKRPSGARGGRSGSPSRCWPSSSPSRS